MAGIEEKTRGDGQHHVAALCPGSDCMTEMEPVFQSRDALNEWRENLPAGDTAVVVEFETDSPPPDYERAPQSDNSRDDSSR